MNYSILCTLLAWAALSAPSCAVQQSNTCEDVIALAREQIMAQKHNVMGLENADNDDAIISDMLRGIGAVYGWTTGEHGARACARAIMNESRRWKEAAAAVKAHRFNPFILMLGYPLMFEREHKQLLRAKADVAEAIGHNAVYDFATGSFGNYAVLREWFGRRDD